MVHQGRIPGHIILKKDISTNLDKIKIIVELSRPQNIKEVQVFMGHCGYYHRFVYMNAIIAKPIYGLITAFGWMGECKKSFENLKKTLISAPILRAFTYSKVFHVHVNAS